MAVKFSTGKSFLLDDDEIYSAVVVKIDPFTRGGYRGEELVVEIFDKKKCIKGKKDEEGNIIETSLGKQIKCTLWINDEGEYSSTAQNLIEKLAESKELKTTDKDFETSDLVGALCRVQVVNTPKDGDKPRYSNIDMSKVYAVDDEIREKYKAYKEWKRKHAEDSDAEVTGSKREKHNVNEEEVVKKPKAEEKKSKEVDEKKDKKNPYRDYDD